MKTKTTTHITTPESIDAFLNEAIAEANAAADACVALHRAGSSARASEPRLSAQDWLELDVACDRWLAKRARTKAPVLAAGSSQNAEKAKNGRAVSSMTNIPEKSTSPESINALLNEAIAEANAAADACVALHRAGSSARASEPRLSAQEWLELDAACDRWLAKRARARAQRSLRKAA